MYDFYFAFNEIPYGIHLIDLKSTGIQILKCISYITLFPKRRLFKNAIIYTQNVLV